MHPRYLDPQGLVTLWREALLAQAVLRGRTRGYRHHPQLHRFRQSPSPLSAINAYLRAVHAESLARGYAFDAAKIGPVRTRVSIACAAGQLSYEWAHLLRKLRARSPALHRRWRAQRIPAPHPLFRVGPGPVALWERVRGGARAR